MPLTSQQIADMEAAAAGTITPPGTTIPEVIVNPYPGCPQGMSVGATQKSIPQDPSKFNTDQCGLLSFYVDTTNTAITNKTTLVLGGQISTGREQVAEDIFGINVATGGLIADLDFPNVVGVDSANFNPTDLMDWLQDIFAARNFVFQRLDIERTSGDADLTVLGKIRKFSLSPEGDWEVCNPKLQQNFCEPCFQDDGSRASYVGFFPVSAVDAVALDIPAGLALTFEWCVFEYENAKNMTKCAA